jgi:hypothetical protein
MKHLLSNNYTWLIALPLISFYAAASSNASSFSVKAYTFRTEQPSYPWVMVFVTNKNNIITASNYVKAQLSRYVQSKSIPGYTVLNVTVEETYNNPILMLDMIQTMMSQAPIVKGSILSAQRGSMTATWNIADTQGTAGVLAIVIGMDEDTGLLEFKMGTEVMQERNKVRSLWNRWIRGTTTQVQPTELKNVAEINTYFQTIFNSYWRTFHWATSQARIAQQLLVRYLQQYKQRAAQK